MGRTLLTLKPFIDKHLPKGYINFRRLDNGNFEIYTPYKTNDLDPAYEEFFKAYEMESGREYTGYNCKDTIKTAIRNSKIYEVNKEESKNHKFVFRERTEAEIKNLMDHKNMVKMRKKLNKKKNIIRKHKKKILKKINIAVSPDKGYVSGENSYSPQSLSPYSASDESLQNIQQCDDNDSSLDIGMEEGTGECSPDEVLQAVFGDIIFSSVATAESQSGENTVNRAEQQKLHGVHRSSTEFQADSSEESPVTMPYVPVTIYLPYNNASHDSCYEVIIISKHLQS